MKHSVTKDQAGLVCQQRGGKMIFSYYLILSNQLLLQSPHCDDVGDLAEINSEEEHLALLDYYRHSFPLANSVRKVTLVTSVVEASQEISNQGRSV